MKLKFINSAGFLMRFYLPLISTFFVVFYLLSICLVNLLLISN